MIIYSSVQTNRATLLKEIAQFKINRVTDERLVAPRPLPGKFQKVYIAYIKVVDGGVNHQSAKRFKGYKELDEKTYKEIVSDIEFSWTV